MHFKLLLPISDFDFAHDSTSNRQTYTRRKLALIYRVLSYSSRRIPIAFKHYPLLHQSLKMSSVASSSTSAANHPLFSGLSPQLPTVQAAEPTKIALDAFKLAGAMQIAKTFNVDLAVAFDAVETGKKDADLSVPIPKLRIKGDPKKMAQELAAAVSLFYPFVDRKTGLMSIHSLSRMTI